MNEWMNEGIKGETDKDTQKHKGGARSTPVDSLTFVMHPKMSLVPSPLPSPLMVGAVVVPMVGAVVV